MVWKTPKPVPGEAWASKYLEEDKDKHADWLFPWVCESCATPTYKAYE